MDHQNPQIKLYTAQSQVVMDKLKEQGVCYSRREYVRRKYGESAPVFLTAYNWFVAEAQKYLPRPAEAEYPYWAFADPANVDRSGGGCFCSLTLPAGEAIYFDMYEWNQILSLSYLASCPEDGARFQGLLADAGVRQESQVLLTPFYPELKRQVLASWSRLFRHHERILAGDSSGVAHVQAGLWCLKQEWLSFA